MDLGVRSFVGERSADSDARTVQRSWNSPGGSFYLMFLIRYERWASALRVPTQLTHVLSTCGPRLLIYFDIFKCNLSLILELLPPPNGMMHVADAYRMNAKNLQDMM